MNPDTIKSQTIIDVPFGKIMLTASAHYLHRVDLFDIETNSAPQHSAIIEHVSGELAAFFVQAHNTWSIPMMYAGTDFQQRVWHYLRAIPIGETRSYGEVAKALNTSARAVGNACHANPFPIIVPCHRVVAQSGLGGFGGQVNGHQIDVKRWLLKHEQAA